MEPFGAVFRTGDRGLLIGVGGPQIVPVGLWGGMITPVVATLEPSLAVFLRPSRGVEASLEEADPPTSSLMDRRKSPNYGSERLVGYYFLVLLRLL